MFCLGSHYRKQLVFTYDSLDVAANTYNRIISKIKSIEPTGDIDKNIVLEYQNKFKKALANDLNTSLALTTLYDVIKADISNNTKLYLIKDFDQVLSLDLLKEETIDKDLLNYINDMIEKRNVAKSNKDYALADKIRDELINKNIIIKDTKEGTLFEVRK